MDYYENKTIPDIKIYGRKDVFFNTLAGITILFSALHFWPFENSKYWQMLNIPNLCCAVVLIIAAFLSISKEYRQHLFAFIPHISIIAYLAINLFSMSIADSLERPLNYTLKIILTLSGGFFLFQKALSKPKAISLFYILTAVAVSISISACVYTRLGYDPKQFGFHGNVFKYGTYTGILIPLAGIYLLYGSRFQVLWAIVIIITGTFSVGSAGGCLSIFSGLITGLIITQKTSIRLKILICILLSAAALFLSNKVFDGVIGSDFALKEKEGINLRQRYIEWQAEINLLEKRGITGTGAGCVNDYRSNFYYRLPKLNTLKAFDQNGFLAVGAETGLWGLVTFIWIWLHYGKMCFISCVYLRTEASCASAAATANAAAFVSVITANMFSSVHYNGILIVFMLLLSLISSVNRFYGENTGED
jgi:hypothetical protein